MNKREINFIDIQLNILIWQTFYSTSLTEEWDTLQYFVFTKRRKNVIYLIMLGNIE